MIPEHTLREAIRPLIGTFHPRKIILFGSQARGSAHEKSDADILVVARFRGKRRTMMVKMDRAMRGNGIPIELVLLTPEEFERDRMIPGTIARPAWREGKILYESSE